MSQVRQRGQAKSQGPQNGLQKREKLDAQFDGFERTRLLRLILGGLGAVAVVVFLSRNAGALLGPLLKASPPPQSTTKAWLPGVTHFGKLPAGLKGVIHHDADVEKREAVKEAFVWSWDAYEKYAWGSDEFQPLSRTGTNLTSAGGIGYTIVDSLDSLLVLDLLDEYKRAAEWVRTSLSFDKEGEFNTFETTIRMLGGLLSAYYLTSTHGDPSIQADAPMYLELATDLGDRLLGAFSTPTGIPLSNINLATRQGIPDKGNNGLASLAEAASLQLELKYLSHLTGDNLYWKKAERVGFARDLVDQLTDKVTEVIRGGAMTDGIAPIFVSPTNGQFVASDIRLGSRGDSYYEYLIKQYLQTDRQETVYRDMYDEAMTGIKKHLVGKTSRSGVLHTQELTPYRDPDTGGPSWRIVPKQDHLVCFLGGSFFLGVTEGGAREVDYNWLEKRDLEDVIVGDGIIESCLLTHKTATGLAPEIAMFTQYTDENARETDWYIKPSQGGVLIDARNILRPETVESLLLAYRLTGHEKYRDAGWEIFQAFNEHCRVPTGAYAGIEDVQTVPAKQLDRMETFWLSETLKYLYLLFDDSDHIPLDKHVFNTEAHILPVFKPSILTPFSTS